MISADIADLHAIPADLHAIPADLRPWRRELLIEALDGAIWQASAAIRFVERGDDDRFADQAIRRAAEFFRSAVASANELRAENRRIEAATKVEAS